jgi:hypothetical protein
MKKHKKKYFERKTKKKPLINEVPLVRLPTVLLQPKKNLPK